MPIARKLCIRRCDRRIAERRVSQLFRCPKTFEMLSVVDNPPKECPYVVEHELTWRDDDEVAHLVECHNGFDFEEFELLADMEDEE